MLITELPEAPLPRKRHLFLLHFQSIQTCYLPSIKAAFFELFISSSSLSSLIYTGFVSHKLISGFAARRGSSSQINSKHTKTKEIQYMVNAWVDGLWCHRNGGCVHLRAGLVKKSTRRRDVKQIKEMQSVLTTNHKQKSVSMILSILHRSRCVSVDVLQCCIAREEDRPCSPREPCVLVGSRSDLIGLSAPASLLPSHTHTHTAIHASPARRSALVCV